MTRVGIYTLRLSPLGFVKTRSKDENFWSLLDFV